MGALLYLMALLDRLSRDHAGQIREAQQQAAKQSADNFHAGLQKGLGVAGRLIALLSFREVVKRLSLPKNVTTSLERLFEHLEDYATDLERGLNSSQQAAHFATEETWRRNRFVPQALQPSSSGEQFHLGATQYLEEDCRDVATALEVHFAAVGAVTQDELAFVLQFKEFADTLNAVMQELQ